MKIKHWDTTFVGLVGYLLHSEALKLFKAYGKKFKAIWVFLKFALNTNLGKIEGKRCTETITKDCERLPTFTGLKKYFALPVLK